VISELKIFNRALKHFIDQNMENDRFIKYLVDSDKVTGKRFKEVFEPYEYIRKNRAYLNLKQICIDLRIPYNTMVYRVRESSLFDNKYVPSDEEKEKITNYLISHVFP
jgi:hypothetical protein